MYVSACRCSLAFWIICRWFCMKKYFAHYDLYHAMPSERQIRSSKEMIVLLLLISGVVEKCFHKNDDISIPNTRFSACTHARWLSLYLSFIGRIFYTHILEKRFLAARQMTKQWALIPVFEKRPIESRKCSLLEFQTKMLYKINQNLYFWFNFCSK